MPLQNKPKMEHTVSSNTLYKNKSPAKKIRSLKRLLNFLSQKMSQPEPTSNDVSNSDNHKKNSTKEIAIQTSEQSEEVVRSEFASYCPECDKIYLCEQVLMFRDHCRVLHDWLWCENWFRGDGCAFAREHEEEVKIHMKSCNVKTPET